MRCDAGVSEWQTRKQVHAHNSAARREGNEERGTEEERERKSQSTNRQTKTITQ